MILTDAVWFSVRSRALGSFLGGIVAVTAGNILGVSLSTAHFASIADNILIGLARPYQGFSPFPHPIFFRLPCYSSRCLLDLGHSLGYPIPRDKTNLRLGRFRIRPFIRHLLVPYTVIPAELPLPVSKHERTLHYHDLMII